MNYNQKVGKFGEKIAQEYLVRRGYKIVETNIKTSYKEIDIVAIMDDELIFIEVKTRTSGKFGGADESMFPQKTENLKKAIDLYLDNFNKEIQYRNVRLDLISVDIDKFDKLAKIKHYRDIA